jgi:hypothetical protein
MLYVSSPKSVFALLLSSLLTLPLHAEDQTTQTIAEKPEPTFQVLRRSEVVIGDRSIVFQRVAPPQTTAAMPAPAATATRELTAQEFEAIRQREAKQQRVLFFSANTLDHRVTELSWSEGGKTYRAFSNIDFQYFKGLNEVETADSVYTLLMAFGTGSADALAERLHDYPQLALLPTDHAAWLLIDGAASESGWTQYAWDSIHRYVDAHCEQIIREYLERELARTKQEQWEHENPPPPKKRVITYWIGKSAPASTSSEVKQ